MISDGFVFFFHTWVVETAHLSQSGPIASAQSPRCVGQHSPGQSHFCCPRRATAVSIRRHTPAHPVPGQHPHHVPQGALGFSSENCVVLRNSPFSYLLESHEVMLVPGGPWAQSPRTDYRRTLCRSLLFPRHHGWMVCFANVKLSASKNLTKLNQRSFYLTF